MAKKPTPEEQDQTAPPPAGDPDAAPSVPEGAPTEVAEGSDPEPTVVVTAVQASRWRIGRQFGCEPVSIPAEDLTEAQFAALMSDPLLIVSVVQAPH